MLFDAAPSDSDETPDNKLEVEEPVHLYLFSHDSDDVRMHDGDDTRLEIIESEKNGHLAIEVSL